MQKSVFWNGLQYRLSQEAVVSIMKIRQFRYAADNFGYLIYGEKQALAVDGGAVDKMREFLETRRLTLKFAVNTHSHPDHTMGTWELVRKSGAVFLDNQTLLEEKKILLEDIDVQVFSTPGHTIDSLVFHVEDTLITGDTLFTGTIGNCFSGDYKLFFNSIQFLMTFDKQTIIYPGHDYVQESMKYAEIIDPENPFLDSFLKTYNPNHVFSTLADELKINPYIRFNDKKMIDILKEKDLPRETEFERWETIYNMY